MDIEFLTQLAHQNNKGHQVAAAFPETALKANAFPF